MIDYQLYSSWHADHHASIGVDIEWIVPNIIAHLENRGVEEALEHSFTLWVEGEVRVKLRGESKGIEGDGVEVSVAGRGFAACCISVVVYSRVSFLCIFGTFFLFCR